MEVRLVRDEARGRSACASAWLLPGKDAAAWVSELAHWGQCQESARIHVLPDGCGAVVTVARGMKPPTTARAIPYQKIGCLYFPVDARTQPPVCEEDVEEWFPKGTAVLHPIAGLVYFGPEEALPITAFLAAPQVRPTRWNMAQSGNAPRPRLLSITLKPGGENVERFLEQSRGDIGRQPLASAPSYAEEIKAPITTRTSHALQEQFYKALEKMTGQRRKQEYARAQSKASNTFLGRLGQWATARLAQIETHQRREMDRLLHLLKTDPDAGLRFAPPLGSRGYRGRHDLPASTLAERDTDFNLAGLGGGHVASPWSVDYEIYERLRREYREAANRELRLKRYRRAAYIFANLLDDFSAAASALVEGGHFREAALLYRDHINNPVKAAACFWEAGDMDSAEPLYVEHGKFERLGELYALVDRPDASRAAYRRAATHAAQMNDYLKASRLLVEHLDAHDEALEILRQGWPFTEQAKDCVREEFALLAAQGRHCEASYRVTDMIHKCPSRRHLGPLLIESLGAIAESYPYAPVRTLACDLVRVETGNRLDQLSPNEAARVLSVLRSLAPHDRLLLRDTQRFLTSRKRQLLPAPPSRPEGSVDVKLFNIISLPGDAQWLAAIPFPGGYYGLGINGENQLVLMRKIWLGRRVELSWPYPFSNRRFSLAAPPEREGHRDRPVHIECRRPLTLQTSTVRASGGEVELKAGSLHQSPSNSSLGLTFAPTGELWELSLEDDAMVLKSYDSSDFHLLSSAHTASLFGKEDTAEVQRRTAPVPMASIDGQVFFALRSFLCRYRQGDFAWLELPDAITDLQCSPANGQPVVAAAMASAGIGIISCGNLWGVWEHHAPDLDKCKVRFLHDGLLAVANTRLLELYRINTSSNESKRCARETFKLPNLLAIVPGDEPDVLVLMTSLQSHYYRMIER
ncbi:MAG: hypothetical protein KDN22_03155 [Verrucomicrobiae bacterium]|nr:hypothetical protein [Verrucomicrobiae bacterium]